MYVRLSNQKQALDVASGTNGTDPLLASGAHSREVKPRPMVLEENGSWFSEWFSLRAWGMSLLSAVVKFFFRGAIETIKVVSTVGHLVLSLVFGQREKIA